MYKLNKEKQYTRIMESGGLLLIGVMEKKASALYSGEIMDIITEIAVVNVESRAVLYHEYLGNNYINYNCSWLADAVELFLYWIATENPNVIDIKTVLHSAICAHNGLFYDRIRRQKERAEKEAKLFAIALDYSVKTNAFEKWVSDRGLIFYNGLEKAFVLIMDKNNTRAFSFLDTIQKEDAMELVKAGKINGARIIYETDAFNTACYNGMWYKIADFEAIKEEITKILER